MEFNETNNQVDETKEIVTFNEESDLVVNSESVSVPSVFMSNARDGAVSDVVGFLSRPLEYANFNWTTSQSAGTIVTPAVALPSAYFTFPMITEKLKGFGFLRCDFVIRVQVNAQPFNAGRLLVWFEPLSQQQANTSGNSSHFGGATGFHRVDLDVSESTAVELRVPYISNLSHFDLATGAGLLGRVYTTVYSQLTGLTDCQGTVWIRAENIDIQVATGAPQNLTVAVQNSNIESRGEDYGSQETPAIEAQTQKERKAGRIEELANKVSSIAKSFASVPVLGIYARAATYVSDALGGVASLFGWSKPTDTKFTTVVQHGLFRTLTNYNGDSKEKKLTLEAASEVIPPPGSFGTEQDELALSYILSRFTYLTRFNMLKSDGQNAVIFKWPVAPNACTALTTTAGSYIRLSTMLSYVCDMFRNWRGGIKYRFKIVKTRYHSGRIRVAFVPRALMTTPLSTIDVNKCYSQIYDIRDRSEFEFTVPYIHTTNWINMVWTARSDAAKIAPTYYPGIIIVEVLNSLRNPSTASDTIEFLVETAAAEDFQVAIPYVNRWTHVLYDGANPPAEDLGLKVSMTDLIKTTETEKVNPHKVEKFNRSYTDAEKEKYKHMNPIMWPPGTGLSKHQQDIAKATKKLEDEKNAIRQQLAESRRRDNAAYMQTMLRDAKHRKMGDAVISSLLSAYAYTLPYGSHNDEAVVDETGNALPTHRYTTYDQNMIWRKFLRDNPGKESVKPIFLNQYPDPAGISKSITMAVQNSNIDQSKPVLSYEFCAGGPGEIIKSLRQVLKRYEPGSTAATVTLIQRNLTFWPFYTGSAASGNTTQRFVADWNTFYDRCENIFRWYTGSVRLIFLPDGGSTSDVIFELNVDNNAIPANQTKIWSNQAAQSFLESSGQALFVPGVEGSVEIGVPFYQRYAFMPTGVGGMRIADYNYTQIAGKVPYNYGSSIQFSTLDTQNVFRSVGEDFNFGYLIGPPPLVSGLTIGDVVESSQTKSD